MNILEKERDLLARLACNDSSAVEAVYRDHFPVIQSMILSNNGNPEDAGDVFQEGMIVLYEKSKSPEFELNCQIRTYLYSVCRRIWLKKLSGVHKMYADDDLPEEIVSVEEDMETHERRQAEFDIMEEVLGKIGEPCKSLLEAYYLQKKDMQQIAESFGYTNADNAKNQKYKCLTRLKKLFFAQYKR